MDDLAQTSEIKTHFKHNVFIIDDTGEILEHLGGIEDYLIAAQLYQVAVKRWPKARIQMRQEARVVYDSHRGHEEGETPNENPAPRRRTGGVPGLPGRGGLSLSRAWGPSRQSAGRSGRS
jgi:hypothetical protein